MPHRKILLLMTLAAVAACDGGSDGTQTGGTGGSITGGTGGAGGVTTGGTGGAGGEASGPSVTGVLEDEGGQPVAGADVLCCSTTSCYVDSSNTEGRFFFSFVAELPADFVLKSLENTQAVPRRAATMFPLRFVDTALVDAGALLVPSLPAGAVLGPESSDPQALDAGDGLQLVVRRADLTPPLTAGSLVDIAAREILPEHVPPLPELGEEEIVGVYALYPFGTTSESPIAVRAPSGLSPGTPVRFRTLGELDGKLSAPAEGEADGAHVETAAGAGIDHLTWLVISR